MQDYRKLKVWEKSHLLTLRLYQITNDFPKHELYGITSQIRRAGSSVPANLAEGSSKATDKHLLQYVQTALGSLNELEYFVLLSKDLSYITHNVYDEIISIINEVKIMLLAFISKLKTT
ncbi:MAG: four helix bundle protein [Cytophagaceae bacterium]